MRLGAWQGSAAKEAPAWPTGSWETRGGESSLLAGLQRVLGRGVVSGAPLKRHPQVPAMVQGFQRDVGGVASVLRHEAAARVAHKGRTEGSWWPASAHVDNPPSMEAQEVNGTRTD